MKADSCAPRWGGEFNLGNAVTGVVRAMAVFDDGTGPALYVGGQFTGVGGIVANNIARWDGFHWQTLGTGDNNGVSGAVQVMAVHDDGSGPALYVGGDFDSAGGLGISYVAKWDGHTWYPLNGGTNGGVYAMAEYNDGTSTSLYLGGIFTQADGLTVNRVARWHNSALSAVGSGMTGSGAPLVRALAVFDPGTGPRLYAGGKFSSPGTNIVSWNGTTWSILGAGTSAGVSNTVDTMTVFNDGNGNDLYVGGGFTSAGGVVNCRRVARWDGAAWSALDTGFGDKEVNALQVYDDGNGPALYAAGTFSKSGASSNPPALQRLAKWTPGTTGYWSQVDSGLPDDNRNPCWCGLSSCDCGLRPAVGWAMGVYKGGLYIGGDFVFLTSDTSCFEDYNLIRWQCPLAGASRADLDYDGDVDLDDFELFIACYTGPNVGEPTGCCARADFDGDADVDQDDFGVFQRCYSGSGIPTVPGCDQ